LTTREISGGNTLEISGEINIFGSSRAQKWPILRIFPQNAPKSNVHHDETLPTLIDDKRAPKDSQGTKRFEL